jgi:hypothetical protein
MYQLKLTALFLLVIFISTITAAQDDTGNANTAGNANANTTVNSRANTNANTNTNINVNANANKIVNTNVNANVNTNVNTNASTNVNANGTTNANSAKVPPPAAKLQIVFSGVDPNDKDNTVLKVKDISNPLQESTFLAKDTQTKALLTKFKEGDIVSVSYTTDKDVKILKDVSVVSQKANEFWHYFVPVLTFAALLGLSWLVLRPRARDLIVGKDNRYSKSKIQIAAWFFVLITGYIAFFIIRLYYSDWNLIGGIGIPTNLLVLSGLSGLTFVAAKGITQGNVAADPTTKMPAAQPKFSDLFRDDENRIDLADFQMMVVTFIAVLTYVVQIFGFLGIAELYQSVSLPDVDSTILAAFGLGQGAYLVKKAVTEGTQNPPNPANPANPVAPASTVIITPPESDAVTIPTPPTPPAGGN